MMDVEEALRFTRYRREILPRPLPVSTRNPVKWIVSSTSPSPRQRGLPSQDPVETGDEERCHVIYCRTHRARMADGGLIGQNNKPKREKITCAVRVRATYASDHLTFFYVSLNISFIFSHLTTILLLPVLPAGENQIHIPFMETKYHFVAKSHLTQEWNLAEMCKRHCTRHCTGFLCNDLASMWGITNSFRPVLFITLQTNISTMLNKVRIQFQKDEGKKITG